MKNLSGGWQHSNAIDERQHAHSACMLSKSYPKLIEESPGGDIWLTEIWQEHGCSPSARKLCVGVEGSYNRRCSHLQ